MTDIEILQEQFKAAANKYPGLEHTIEDRLTEDCDPAVSSAAADRRMYKSLKEKRRSIDMKHSWSMLNIRGATEKGYPKVHYLHRSPLQNWDEDEAVDLFLLRAEEAGKLLIPLPELEGLWVADPAEYWLLALHRVFPGLKLKEACELTEDELEMAAGGSYLNSLHPRKGDEYFEVLDDVFTKSALLCGKLLEIVKDLPKHLPREPKADCTKNENRQQKPAGTDQKMLLPAMQIEGDSWITITEAANLLAINPGVISRWANEGKIKDNGKTRRARRVLTSSVLLMKQKKENAELLEDVKELRKDSKDFR